MNTYMHGVSKIKIIKDYLETLEAHTLRLEVTSKNGDFDLTLFTENAEPVEIEYDN